jgi:hypothetical protein
MTADLPIAAAGALGDVICLVGLLAVLGWIAWRFGPTLARIAGWASWWVAWACGSQGGYAYCAVFLLLGIVAWGAGTIWFARRRGRWPSAVSAWLFGRVLGRQPPLLGVERLHTPAARLGRDWPS